MFTISGSGTVVTGTLTAGTIRDGDEFDLMPEGRRVRVRSIESLKLRAHPVPPVARVALNLRGTARLSLASPLPLHVGDQGLLRHSTREVIGLGVLDVLPPPLRRRGGSAERDRQLTQAGAVPDADFFLRQHGVMRRSQLVATGCATAHGPVAGDWLADPVFWAALSDRLRLLVSDYAAQHPLEPGLPAGVACQSLGLPDRRLLEALVRPPLVAANGRISEGLPRPGLPPDVTTAVERIKADLSGRPFCAPEAARLAEVGLDRRAVGAAIRARGAG